MSNLERSKKMFSILDTPDIYVRQFKTKPTRNQKRCKKLFEMIDDAEVEFQYNHFLSFDNFEDFEYNCFVANFGFALLTKIPLFAQSFFKRKNEDIHWLSFFYIKPEFRGKGYGHYLFDIVSNKISTFYFTVNQQNQYALDFYKHLGCIDAKFPKSFTNQLPDGLIYLKKEV